MPFIIIRLIFFCIVLIAAFLIIKKQRLKNERRNRIIAFISAMVLTTLFSLFPVENAFVSFPTAEKAYAYNHTGKVKLTVNGNDSDFIVGEKGNTDVYAIIPKTNNRFKIGMGTDMRQVFKKTSDGISVCVYRFKETDDYYISVFDADGGETEITDNCNSVFEYTSSFNSALNKKFYTYYAFIENYNDGYSVSVNGKTQIKTGS